MSEQKTETWFSLLSKGQKTIFFLSSLIGLSIIIALTIPIKQKPEVNPDKKIDLSMSIKQIAPKLGITGKSLARELKLPLDTPKEKPLSLLNITAEDLEHVVEHQLSHVDATAKYPVFLILVIWGIIYLSLLGRPKGADIKQRKGWFPRAPYIISLIISIAVCGFYFGKSPNPMEGIVKVFKSMVGLYPDPLVKVTALLFFLTLVILGNKLICGWACPFGALQELIYSLPILKKLKNRKLPFLFTNTVRATLFIIMLLLLFAIIGNQKGLVIYHSLNPFNLFNLDFEETSILITVIASLILAFWIYRPFCMLICPFGFVSWIFEQLSVTKVRINPEKCDQCNACIKACPTESTKALVYGKSLPADCFSCGRCLKVCPQDAIKYSLFCENELKNEPTTKP
jgi:ferredoxin